MSYTGNVSVGGPADTRELPGLTITKVSVGPMDNNAYLLRCIHTGELALIDAANDPGTLLGLIGDTPLAAIITTHRHWDHHAALRQVQQATGASTSRIPRTHPSCRSRSPGRYATGTRSRSATRGSPSSTCAATRQAASRSATTPTANWPTSRTCSPATHCSPAGRAIRRTTRSGSAA